MKWISLLLLFSTSSLFAQSGFEYLNEAFKKLESDTSYKNANISFTLREQGSGKLLFEKNKDLLLPPASTLKTLTTATALQVLGPDFRYRTRIGFKGVIRNKTAYGQLIVYASGDPSFGSDRFHEMASQQIFKQIQAGLVRLGVSTMKGSVEVVDTLFNDEAINTGWLDEDIGNYYGAGIYPLNWKENKFEINLIPTETSFEVSSNNAGYDNRRNFCIELIHKEGATSEEAFAFVEKNKPCQYVIRGVLTPKDPIQNLQLARLQPQEDFKKELIAFLKKQLQFESSDSIVTGNEKVICTILSPPLSKLVYWCNQKSLNLYAEAFCKTMAVALFKKGNWPLGISSLIRYMNSLHIQTKGVHLKDASGLAPENRITTAILSQLLTSNTSKKWFPVFYESLPSINGLIMKSGYIGGTRSYTGYITLKDKRQAAFAFVINNYTCTPRAVKHDMFRILDLMK